MPATSVAATTIVLLPGVSVTRQDRVPCVTAVGAPLHVTPAMPESVSATVPDTVICAAVRVAPDAGEVMASAGMVLSMFRETDAVAEFPELSAMLREIV